MCNPENINLVYKIVDKRNQELFGAFNALDQKMSVIAGFLSTIMVGVLGLLKEELEMTFCPFDTNFFTLGVVALSVSLFICVYILTTRRYSHAPHLDTIYSDEVLNGDFVENQNQITADVKKAIDNNCTIHEGKAKLFNYALWISFFGVALIFVYFLKVYG